jgi:hypothetical protein
MVLRYSEECGVNRSEWIGELHKRQRNIAPGNTIENDVLVERTLIRGDRRLTRIQRIAAVLLSLIPCTTGGLILWAAFNIAGEGGSSVAGYVAVSVITLIGIGVVYIGYRMICNGIIGGRRSCSHRRL